MIHSPMAGVRGNPEQISTTLNVLKELEVEMAVAYAEKSNLTPVEMLKLMRAETWFTLREAQQVFRGIEADDMKVAASINPEWLRTFSNAPLDLVVDMHTAAAKPKPKVSAGEQRAAKKRNMRKSARLMLMAASRKLDPVAAKRQRERHRLEIRAELFARKDLPMSRKRKMCSSREGTLVREVREIQRRLDQDVVNQIAVGAAGLSGEALEKFCGDVIANIVDELLAADPRLAREACFIYASAHVRAGLGRLLQTSGGSRA